MDMVRLHALRDDLAARGTKTLLVARHERIVYEWYAPGYGPSQRHYTASLAKALVGGMSLLLALNDGLMGVDDLACEYIPAWRDYLSLTYARVARDLGTKILYIDEYGTTDGRWKCHAKEDSRRNAPRPVSR